MQWVVSLALVCVVLAASLILNRAVIYELILLRGIEINKHPPPTHRMHRSLLYSAGTVGAHMLQIQTVVGNLSRLA
jgi:hypothetical protein